MCKWLQFNKDLGGNSLKRLAIVVPCFNEEEVLPITVPELERVIFELIQAQKISVDSQIVFVDDGSHDQTWPLIEHFTDSDDHVTGIKLSRNFGHQDALIAGLTSVVSSFDAVVTIDADLQDDVNAIKQMVDCFLAGAEVVYGVRSSRQTDTWFKRSTAEGFYKTMNFLGVHMVPDSADFRLLSQRATQTLLDYPERNLFLRGIVPLLGFRSAKVSYERHARVAGVSKYPLKKMIRFAVDGITSFSTAPIKLIMNLGFLIVLICIGLLIYTLVQKIQGRVVSGWSSLMISVWALGGVQLICISVIGEYVGKIFTEVKQRPRFTIERNLLQEQIEAKSSNK